jgi:hypothetical protein
MKQVKSKIYLAQSDNWVYLLSKYNNLFEIEDKLYTEEMPDIVHLIFWRLVTL